MLNGRRNFALDKSAELMRELDKYWEYYIILENDVLAMEQYVAFADANLETYSNQFLKMLQIICSEIDALLKILCGYYDSSVDKDKNKNMNFYKKTIKKYYPQLSEATVTIKRRDNISEIQPWKNIISDKKLGWWDDYTQIKHNRMGRENSDQCNYMKANLKNILNSLAALMIIENELYMALQNEGCKKNAKSPLPLNPVSKLFYYKKIDDNFFALTDCFFEKK